MSECKPLPAMEVAASMSMAVISWMQRRKLHFYLFVMMFMEPKGASHGYFDININMWSTQFAVSSGQTL